MKYIVAILLLIHSTISAAASYGGVEFGVVVTFQRNLIPEGSGQTFTFTRTDTSQRAEMLLSIEPVGFGREDLFVSTTTLIFDAGVSEQSVDVNVVDNGMLDEAVKSIHFNSVLDGYEMLSWVVPVDDRNSFERGLFSASLNSNIYKYGTDIILDVKRDTFTDKGVDLLAVIYERVHDTDRPWAVVPIYMMSEQLEAKVDLTSYLTSGKTFSVELSSELPIIVKEDTGYFDVIDRHSSLATLIYAEDSQYEISGLGSFPITLVRSGNLSYEVSVKLSTNDPYIKVLDKEVVFLQNQSQRVIFFENNSFDDRDFMISLESFIAYSDDVSVKVTREKAVDPRTMILSTPYTNIAHGVRILPVTVKLAAPLHFDLPIDLVGYDDTAIEGEHYSIEDNSGVIVAGQQEITFNVIIYPESIKSAKSFRLGLISEFFTSEYTDLATISLLEEPEIEASYVSIVESKLSFYEGEGVASIVLERSGNLETSFNVVVSYSDVTAISNVDYVPIVEVIPFVPFQTVANISITLIDNNFADGDKDFKVQIETEDQFVGLKGAEAIVTIIDDDYHLANFISFNAEGVTAYVGEDYLQEWTVNEGTATRKLTILREGDTSQALELTLKSSDLTASAGSDYKAINERIIFAPGDNHKEISVMFVSGSITNLKESFLINVKSNNPNLISTGNLLLITINSDSPFGESGDGALSGGSMGSVFITLIGLLFIVRWRYLIELYLSVII